MMSWFCAARFAKANGTLACAAKTAEPYGIEFPALPEVGIDGRTVAFDPEDLIPVF